MVRLTIEIDEAAYEALRREAEAGGRTVQAVAAGRLAESKSGAAGEDLRLQAILDFADEHATAEHGLLWVRGERDKLYKREPEPGRPGISIWDALVISTAAKAGCDEVLTEDLNPGQVIGGVRVVSPFGDDAP